MLDETIPARVILDNVNDAIIALDPQSRIILWNPAAESLYGWRADEVLGRPQSEIVPVLHYVDGSTHAQVLAIFYEQGFWQGEVVQPHRDGHALTVASSVRLLRHGDGRPRSLIAINRDITAQGRIQGQLQASEARFQAQYQGVPVPTMTWQAESGDFVLVDANRAAFDFTQGRIDAFIGSRASVVYAASPDALADFARSYAEQTLVHRETWWTLQTTGDRRFVSVTYAPIPPDLIMIHIVDLTERKQAELALHEREQQLLEAQYLARVGSWTMDIESNHVTWSEELYRIFGLDPHRFTASWDAVIGCFHPEERVRVRQIVYDAQQACQPFEYEARVVRPDGDERILQARGQVIGDSSGAAVRMIGVAQDITEHKQAEARLRALSQRLVEAHEAERKRLARELHDHVGQALTAVKLNLQVLTRSHDPASREHHLAQSFQILEQTNQDIRALMFNLRPPHLDDLGLVAALTAWVREEAARSGYQWQVLGPDTPLALSPDLMITCFRVVQEALTNVARYAQAEHVVVEVRCGTEVLQLTVSDDGRGFDPQAVQDGAIAHAHMGLVGMRERVELIGGRLDIRSALGHGTTIDVVVPLLTAE